MPIKAKSHFPQVQSTRGKEGTLLAWEKNLRAPQPINIPRCHPTASHLQLGNPLAHSNTPGRRQQRRRTGSQKHWKWSAKLMGDRFGLSRACRRIGSVLTLLETLPRASLRAKARLPNADGRRRKAERRRVRAVGEIALTGQS